jgi:hypothetical protein
LASDPSQRALVLSLNTRLNALTADEIGPDDGGFLPFFVGL